MKVLKAQIKPDTLKHLDLQLFNVNDLICIPPKDWLEKRMNEFEYQISFEKHGMKYPICVSTHEHEWVRERFARKNLPHIENGKVKPGLYVQSGNKRVLWARQNGYDQIEGYLVSTIEDKAVIRAQTHINHGKIPK